MIPDDEIAYHAGDSTQVSYNMRPTGVKVKGEGLIDISKDGYFTIDGEKSIIIAPTDTEGNVLTKESINSMGLRLEDIDGEWNIGEVYFNEDYKLIANRGGNNNSIGMEISMAVGENIELNLQRAAKLTVKLLKDNNLTMDDIKQHHFFSGKNCPQTLRENGLWEYFLKLIEVEAIVDSYISDGYKITLECSSVVVNPNGSIDKLPGSIRGIEYTVITEYKGTKESAMFVKLI